ncbi:hypothetical protein [Methylobacterium dankookense]|uniref:Uncharacterized protein n=1 Tax=Methylobacterium dankookense TaxID=560405 RepID=A0A564G359_9HYPH|nr:hypothetical protein [Methylobacterium dankookense]GJD54707.1 hypothetical protein IFDJLNFL_0586 [Methylobacterium dankookense]VUF14400.1 hypothetical protein MTDSW087_04121 [Methylobacterium dankookense]
MKGRFSTAADLIAMLNKVVPRLLGRDGPCPTVLLHPGDYGLIESPTRSRLTQRYLPAIQCYVFFEMANSVGLHAEGTYICGVSAGDSYGHAVRRVTKDEASEGILPVCEIKGTPCGVREFLDWWSPRRKNIYLAENPGYRIAFFHDTDEMTSSHSEYEFFNRWF